MWTTLKARQPSCRYHIQSFIPQLICFRYHLRKETNGWQLRLASLQRTLHYCWRMFVPQWLETPANTLLSSTLLVASHSSFPWQLMFFFFFSDFPMSLSFCLIWSCLSASLLSCSHTDFSFFVGSCVSLLGDFIIFVLVFLLGFFVGFFVFFCFVL